MKKFYIKPQTEWVGIAPCQMCATSDSSSQEMYWNPGNDSGDSGNGIEITEESDESSSDWGDLWG